MRVVEEELDVWDAVAVDSVQIQAWMDGKVKGRCVTVERQSGGPDARKMVNWWL